MKNEPIPIIATVECGSQARGEDRPVAVVIAGERFEIVATLDQAMVTSVTAGDPVRHRLWVEVSDGRRFELNRVLPEGPWRVARFNAQR